MARTVLITGATSGIGKATAELMANGNYRLILSGRRTERLMHLKEKLSEKCEIKTLAFELRDKHKVSEMIGSLEAEWAKIDILINNAGNAHGMAPIHEGDMDDWEAMIDINIKGLLYVSKVVIPGMVERKQGHIINIGSIAGKEVYPGGNIYCASKHAVDAINSGMRMDLLAHGIKVTAINPGLVETEFSLVRFKGDTQRAEMVYQGYQPLQPVDIAEAILFVIERPAHVNISDMIIFPQAQASSTMVHKNS